jgi:hypothetical protein
MSARPSLDMMPRRTPVIGKLPEFMFPDGLPADIEAERSLLGAILLDTHFLKAALESMAGNEFANEAHVLIFRAMNALEQSKRAIDIVTLRSTLIERNDLERVGGVAYLASLTENMPRKVSIEEYVSIVVEKFLARELIHFCSAAIAKAADFTYRSHEVSQPLVEQVHALTARSNTLWRRGSTRKVLVGGLEFLGQAQPLVDWAIEGLVQRGGNGLIVGDPGTAKSLLALDLAMLLVAGVPWLGRNIPKRMKVAIVTREDHPSLTQQRGVHLYAGADAAVQEAIEEINLDEWLYFSSAAQMETFTLENESDLAEIIDGMKRVGVEFAVFDVFRRLWEGDETDNQALAHVLAALTRIQREVGCSVALVHHLSKGEGRTIFQRIRGGGAIYGWREWAFGISIENPGDPAPQRVRRIDFETKASSASDPLYFMLESNYEKTQTTVVQVAPPERAHRIRGRGRGESAAKQSFYEQTSFTER